MKSMRKLLLAGFALMLSFFAAAAANAKDVYYKLSVYHYKTPEQRAMLNDYLGKAFVPAMHRAGIKQVGVFSTLEQDTADRRIYVLLPIKNLEQADMLTSKLSADKQYTADAAAYEKATFNKPPYTRMEVILLSAFPNMPFIVAPSLTSPKAERVYELRSYESATENYHINKVDMFNRGDEIGIFKRLNFNAVFYAHVIAGSHMPNLMYMTTFNNKADRDKHWEAFGSDATWKTLSAKEEYRNNVSHSDIIFLYPADYSDI